MKPKNAGMFVYACTRAFTLRYACLYADAPKCIHRKDILPKKPIEEAGYSFSPRVQALIYNFHLYDSIFNRRFLQARRIKKEKKRKESAFAL